MWWHTRRNQISSFVRNGRIHLNRPGGVSSVDCWQPRCAHTSVVMLDTPCFGVVWRVLATQCIRQFPLHFPSSVSPCAITFQLVSNAGYTMFRGTVKSTGYPLHSPVSTSLPLQCVTVCHHIPTGLFNSFSLYECQAGFIIAGSVIWQRDSVFNMSVTTKI